MSLGALWHRAWVDRIDCVVATPDDDVYAEDLEVVLGGDVALVRCRRTWATVFGGLEGAQVCGFEAVRTDQVASE